MPHVNRMSETAAATELSTQSASASERRLATDGAAAAEHGEESASAFPLHVPARPSLPLLQSTSPPTYELYLLRFWAASRPVARICMATLADRRACRGLRAAWAIHCMTQLGRHDLVSCRGCGHYPTHRTCTTCHLAWCGDCRSASRNLARQILLDDRWSPALSVSPQLQSMVRENSNLLSLLQSMGDR